MNVINALRELEEVAETSLDMRPEFRRAVSNAHSALKAIEEMRDEQEREWESVSSVASKWTARTMKTVRKGKNAPAIDVTVLMGWECAG